MQVYFLMKGVIEIGEIRIETQLNRSETEAHDMNPIVETIEDVAIRTKPDVRIAYLDNLAKEAAAAQITAKIQTLSYRKLQGELKTHRDKRYYVQFPLNSKKPILQSELVRIETAIFNGDALQLPHFLGGNSNPIFDGKPLKYRQVQKILGVFKKTLGNESEAFVDANGHLLFGAEKKSALRLNVKSLVLFSLFEGIKKIYGSGLTSIILELNEE